MKKSVSWGILIAVTVFFCLALYWAVEGVIGSISYLSNSYVYQKLSNGPSWWLVLYYSGEGVAGTAGLIVRAMGGLFAFYAATLFVWKRDTLMPAIKRNAGAALLLEGIYFLSLIPSTLTAFAYYFTDGSVFYIYHTPPMILLYVAALPTLAMVTIMPIVLFKLRSKVVGKASAQDLVKWSSLTASTYVLVVFWFSYSMAWLGNMVSFDRARGQYGWSFLLDPINFTSFIVTFAGLLIVALFILKVTLPASKTLPIKIGLRSAGAVMLAFGGYFIFNLLYFYLTGGYPPHPNVWYEMIGPPHNVNLWCLVFVFLGLTLLISGKPTEASGAT
ncbi:MAG: hypothetical protein ACXV2C_08150 [Candidatus Bathyarchaeia archaeon]